MRPIEPTTLKLLNGEERSFLLSMGAVKRLKSRFKVKTVEELLTRDTEDVLVPVLFEALMNRDGMTEDQFSDLMPVDFQAISVAVAELFVGSMPEAKPNEVPILPSPEIPIQ